MKYKVILFCLCLSNLSMAKTAVVDSKSGQPLSDSSLLRTINNQNTLETSIVNPSHSSFGSSMLEIGFEYPLNFGTHVKYYVSENFYSRLGVGFMAEFFLGSFAKLMPYFGYLNNHETSLISEIFKNSFYTDLRLGWFPYAQSAKGGPYVELGVSGMFLGRGKVSGFTLSKSLNLEDLDSTGYYSLKTNAYNGTFHIGYQVPFERLKINIEVGIIKILHTQLKPFDSIDTKQLNVAQKEKFQNFLKEKGWIFPTISGWIGFSF